jgi:hypothetical protein
MPGFKRRRSARLFEDSASFMLTERRASCSSHTTVAEAPDASFTFALARGAAVAHRGSEKSVLHCGQAYTWSKPG